MTRRNLISNSSKRKGTRYKKCVRRQLLKRKAIIEVPDEGDKGSGSGPLLKVRVEGRRSSRREGGAGGMRAMIEELGGRLKDRGRLRGRSGW